MSEQTPLQVIGITSVEPVYATVCYKRGEYGFAHMMSGNCLTCMCPGSPMKEWELDEAMHIMDADGSGEVDYEE